MQSCSHQQTIRIAREQDNMSINLASTSSSPANTQHSDPGPTPSILEDVISGLIEPRSDAPGEYKPSPHRKSPRWLTMREEIGKFLGY